MVNEDLEESSEPQLNMGQNKRKPQVKNLFSLVKLTFSFFASTNQSSTLKWKFWLEAKRHQSSFKAPKCSRWRRPHLPQRLCMQIWIQTDFSDQSMCQLSEMTQSMSKIDIRSMLAVQPLPTTSSSSHSLDQIKSLPIMRRCNSNCIPAHASFRPTMIYMT